MKRDKSSSASTPIPAVPYSNDPGPTIDDHPGSAEVAENETAPDGSAEVPQQSPPRAGVTNSELQQFESMVGQLNIFQQQFQNLSAHFAAIRTKTACDAYLVDSSPENFEAFKGAAIEEGLIERNVITLTVRATVAGARDTFIANQVLPFVQPILERNLAAFRGELAAVTKDENTLHLETFGTPVENSVKISRSAAQVRQIEELLPIMNEQSMPGGARGIHEYLQSLPILEAELAGK